LYQCVLDIGQRRYLDELRKAHQDSNSNNKGKTASKERGYGMDTKELWSKHQVWGDNTGWQSVRMYELGEESWRGKIWGGLKGGETI
jgi:hypothetical protein